MFSYIFYIDTLPEPTSQQGNSPAAGLIQTMEGKRSSRIATMTRSKDSPDGIILLTGACTVTHLFSTAFLAPVTGVRVAVESPVSSELNEEEESPEPDVDYLDDYDSEEERKQKRRKGFSKKTRSTAVTTTAITRPIRDNDKPFLCNGQKLITAAQ